MITSSANASKVIMRMRKASFDVSCFTWYEVAKQNANISTAWIDKQIKTSRQKWVIKSVYMSVKPTFSSCSARVADLRFTRWLCYCIFCFNLRAWYACTLQSKSVKRGGVTLTIRIE